MKRMIQLTIFATIFTAVYIGMHFFVLSSYFSLLNLKENYIFYILLFLLSFSFILSMIVERKSPNNLARNFYIISSVWMGVLFLSFFVFLAFEIIKLFIQIDNANAGPFVISIIAITSIYSLINGQIIQIKKVTIRIKNLKKPVRAVQLTDIHLGTLRTSNFLNKIVSITNALNPEVVFLTGDLFDGSTPLTKKMISPVNSIRAKTYFTIGNHEIYDGISNVTKVIKTTKLVTLRNKKAIFKNMQIIGIDYSDDKNNLIKELPKIKINKNLPSILLYHPPANIEQIESAGIDLHLAGHTHAGQIFPFNLFVRLVYPHIAGLHKGKSSQAYISQGTGTWGPPMRLSSHNEITLINLIPA